MTIGAGGATVDMTSVQVHPTGLVHPSEPDAKVKFLAAEALRGVGGLLLTNKGQRFVDELQTRDFVTGEMWKAKAGPYRLVLNGKGSNEILWHCKHYVGRGLYVSTRTSSVPLQCRFLAVEVAMRMIADVSPLVCVCVCPCSV